MSKEPHSLTEAELAFLVNGLKAPILTPRPVKDRIINGLVDREFVKVRSGRDPDFVLLELTEAGREAVMRHARSAE